MISISDDAKEFIVSKGQAVFLELAKPISGCCFEFQEKPTVRIGVPRNVEDYIEKTVDEIKLFIPKKMPKNEELEIGTTKFLGMKSLVIRGWKLV